MLIDNKRLLTCTFIDGLIRFVALSGFTLNKDELEIMIDHFSIRLMQADEWAEKDFWSATINLIKSRIEDIEKEA